MTSVGTGKLPPISLPTAPPAAPGATPAPAVAPAAAAAAAAPAAPAASPPRDSAAGVNTGLGAASPIAGDPVQTPFPAPATPNPEAEDAEDDGDWGISGFLQEQNNSNVAAGTGAATGTETTTMGAALTYRRNATDEQLGIDGALSYNQTDTNGLDGSERRETRLRGELTVGTNEAEMARAQRLAQGGN